MRDPELGRNLCGAAVVKEFSMITQQPLFRNRRKWRMFIGGALNVQW